MFKTWPRSGLGWSDYKCQQMEWPPAPAEVAEAIRIDGMWPREQELCFFVNKVWPPCMSSGKDGAEYIDLNMSMMRLLTGCIDYDFEGKPDE
eukprot:1297510-Pyramimonas_sp.AAC.1